jgi:hypothetical protein
MVNISTKCLLWVTVSPKIRVKGPIFKLILIIYPIFFQIQIKTFDLALLIFKFSSLKVGKIHELSFYNV